MIMDVCGLIGVNSRCCGNIFCCCCCCCDIVARFCAENGDIDACIFPVPWSGKKTSDLTSPDELCAAKKCCCKRGMCEAGVCGTLLSNKALLNSERLTERESPPPCSEECHGKDCWCCCGLKNTNPPGVCDAIVAICCCCIEALSGVAGAVLG